MVHVARMGKILGTFRPGGGGVGACRGGYGDERRGCGSDDGNHGRRRDIAAPCSSGTEKVSGTDAGFPYFACG